MTIGIFGEKLGMTHIFNEDGVSIPVTLLKVDTCQISQIKTFDTDGYNAVQVAYEEKKIDKLNKPIRGHLKKSSDQGFHEVFTRFYTVFARFSQRFVL